MEKIKVGLIGGGGIADAHLLGYQTYSEQIVVSAVADVDPVTLERRCAELGVTGYADYARMIDEADIDAVDICLPHHLHKDAIVRAATAGKHILCEKPLCLTAAEAVEVQAAVRDNGITLMSAHNQLFMPSVAKARELLDAGVLGTVYEVRTTDSFYNDFDPASMGWRASTKTSGGGELIDTGYHPTYLMLHLAAAVPVEATAMLSTHRLAFMEGEDSAQVLVRFDNGVVGQLVTSWAYQPSATTERFSVVGELGALHSDNDGARLTVSLRSGETEVFEFEPVDTYVAEIGHFADALQNGTRPIHTEKEGIEALGILLAAYEGARTKTVAPVATPTTPQISLRPVARVESTLTSLQTAPRQATEGAPSAWLVFDDDIRRAAEDLRIGDDVIVLTWLDQGDRSVLAVHPRDDQNLPITGVFSTRSSDRPNPVGLHPCRIVAIDGLRMQVNQLEAIDGTPVIDVKPILGPAR